MSLYKRWKYRLGVTDYGVQLWRLGIFFDYRMTFDAWDLPPNGWVIVVPLVRIVWGTKS